MATNLERLYEEIRGGLEDTALDSLERLVYSQPLGPSGYVRTGFLRDSVEVRRSGDDFVIEFADYGVFIDEGTGSSLAYGPRPFYSNLVVDGEEEGEYESELEEILGMAFDQDVQDLENDFENNIN